MSSAGLYPMDGDLVVVAPAVLLDDDDLLGVGVSVALVTAVSEAEMTAAIHVMTTSVLDDDLGVLGLGRRGHWHHEPDGGKRRQREKDLAHCGVSLNDSSPA